jgi:hypothetical protein
MGATSSKISFSEGKWGSSSRQDWDTVSKILALTLEQLEGSKMKIWAFSKKRELI